EECRLISARNCRMRCGTQLPIEPDKPVAIGNAVLFCTALEQTVVRRKQGQKTEARDRKSTRLNSSHSQISYAVFCLKKKNKKNQEPVSEPSQKHDMDKKLIAPVYHS